MILGRLVVGESVVEDRQEDEVEAHSPSKRGRRRGSAGQGVVKQRAHTPAAAQQACRVMGRISAPHPAVARAHLEDFVCSCRLVVTVPPTRDLRRFGRGFHVIVSPADRVCGTDTCHGCVPHGRSRLHARPWASCPRRSNIISVRAQT